jgi:protease I
MILNSHDLAAKYTPISPELRSSLNGKAYDVPDFGTPDPANLIDLRVAIVMTHGPELIEFDVPYTYLRERGAAVSIVTQDWLFDYPPDKNRPGSVVLAEWLAVEVAVQADKRISDARVQDYDAVIFLGGAWNPIMLRTDSDPNKVMQFIRDAHESHLLIAAICHGPQVLISSGAFPHGTRATGVDDIWGDMANAGMEVVKDPVVYDAAQRLITCRNPDALKEFCVELGSRLLELHGK